MNLKIYSPSMGLVINFFYDLRNLERVHTYTVCPLILATLVNIRKLSLLLTF